MLSNLKPFPKSRKNRKCRGRGNASGHGTYSGRGQKGQRARSGGKKSLKLKGLKSFLQQIPKSSGFKGHQIKLAIVNLKDLEKHFQDGETVTPEKLLEKGLISKMKGKIPKVKILGQGKLTKKLMVKNCQMSKKVKNLIFR